jgi:hypothetical protein
MTFRDIDGLTTEELGFPLTPDAADAGVDLSHDRFRKWLAPVFDTLDLLTVMVTFSVPNDQVVRVASRHHCWSDAWGRGESNPHWLEPKSSASACWATAPVLPGQGSPGGELASHDILAFVR